MSKGKNLNAIGSKWESFRLAVIPANAPQVQITEMRRAFYGGAQALLAFQKSPEVSGDHVPDEEGARILQGVEDELIEFAGKIGKDGY